MSIHEVQKLLGILGLVSLPTAGLLIYRLITKAGQR